MSDDPEYVSIPPISKRKMELWPPEFREAVSELIKAIYEYDDEYERRVGKIEWERIRKARDEVVKILERS